MSDEAIVRLVIADSTSGARTSDTQSSTAGLSSSAVAGIDPIRLYREIGNAVVEINKGFKASLTPAINVLGEIRDTLNRDYDYSEKDYRESTTQTSLLRLIGASLSGDTGAVGREIKKGVGLQTADTQMIASMDDASRNIRELKLSLSPEAERDRFSASSAMLKGALVGLGIEKLPDLWKIVKPPIKEFYETSSIDLDKIGDNIADYANVAKELATQFPAETTALIVGAIAGALIYSLTPGPKEKEKSVNELLADIIKLTENQNPLSLLDSIAENTRLTANATSVTFETANKILALMPGHDPYAEFGGVDALRMQETDRTGYPDLMESGETGGRMVPPPILPPHLPIPPIYPVATLASPFETDPLNLEPGATLNPGDIGADLRQEHSPSIDINPPASDSNIPVAVAHATALDPVQEEEDILRNMREEVAAHFLDEWANWQPTHWGPNQFLSQDQLGELAEANVHPEEVPNTGGRQRLSAAGLEQFLQYRERQNLGPPEYFAQGGAVGSDTISAMLSPGEVVVPKKMVDGGAVDHLRGKLPGFAEGGLVASYGQMLTNMAGASTDPSERLGRFGDGISAIGAKIGTAVPVVGAFVTGLGEGIKAISTLTSAINESVDKYGEYNSQIAQAQAIVEINQTMGDLRRAQEIGPELARFVIVQGEMQQKFEEVKIKLLMQIVPAVSSILEMINTMMASGQGAVDVLSLLIAPLTLIADAANEIRGIQKDARIPDVQDPTTALFDKGFDTSVPGGGSLVPIR